MATFYYDRDLLQRIVIRDGIFGFAQFDDETKRLHMERHETLPQRRKIAMILFFFFKFI